MFLRESEMAPSVASWLSKLGLQVRPEFVTPWGICDFVGLSFNQERAAHRIRLRQHKTITSITRAALLLTVPEVESSKSVSLKRLIRTFESSIPADVVASEIDRLVTDRFLVRSSRGSLQKLNGWMPLQERLISVELKLSRIDEALQQAKANLCFAEESFVAFPMQVAERIASRRTKWGQFLDGIGLIGVERHECEVLIPALPASTPKDAAIQLYCVDRFWSTRTLG